MPTSNEEGVFHGFHISLPRVPTRWHPYTWPLWRHTIDWALLGERRILVIPLSEDGLSRPPVKAGVVSGLRYVENLPDVPRSQNCTLHYT